MSDSGSTKLTNWLLGACGALLVLGVGAAFNVASRLSTVEEQVRSVVKTQDEMKLDIKALRERKP